MAQAHKGGKINHKINMFVYGDAFTGKTTLGLQLARLHDENGEPMRLLVIDCESGGTSYALDELEEYGVNLDNVYVLFTQSLAETLHYIEQISKGEPLHELGPDGEETDEYVLDASGKPFLPTALFIDGVSILKMTCQQSLLNLSRKRARVRAKNNGLTGEDKAVAIDNATLEYKDYNILNYSGQELILDLSASNIHWVCSSREKKETKSVKVNGSIQSVETGKVVAEAFKGSEYNTSTLVRLFRDEDEPDVVKMEVIKDRSRTWAVGQIVDNPTLLDLQPLIDKHNGNDVVVKNSMDKAVETEMEIYQRKAGIVDEEGDSSNQANDAAAAPSIDDLKKQIKNIHSKLNPDKRKAFSSALKAKSLPTSMSKVDDISILESILSVAKEILGAD